jgi:hypothetical protein
LWRAIANGGVPKITRDRQKYWKHWYEYCSLFQCHPFLNNISPLNRDIIVWAFTARVRSGTFGRGNQIKVQGVTEVLSDISQTIMLVGQQSPINIVEKVYNLSIQHLVKGRRHEDPPVILQLAVPISIATVVYEAGGLHSSQYVKTVGMLSLIAFYYLL